MNNTAKQTLQSAGILICGHIDLSIENFNKYYVPKIEESLNTCDLFYIGGAKGADTYAQEYLSNTNNKVLICDKGEQNNNLYPEKYDHKNGFASYTDRDAYMTDNVKQIIVYLRKNYMSLGSGSFSNIVRLLTNKEIAEEFFKYTRNSIYNEGTDKLNEWCDKVIDNFDKFSNETKEKLKKLTREIFIIDEKNN